MGEYFYHFAGIDLAVIVPDICGDFESGRLTPFQVDSVQSPHRFTFSLVDSLTPPQGDETACYSNFRVYESGNRQIRYIGSTADGWEGAYMRVLHDGRNHEVQLKSSQYGASIGCSTVLNALEAEHLVIGEGGIVFHTSYIKWQGRAILFTAPSGTGKSTQAELWHSLRGARIINGDRAVIRMAGDCATAEGIPFSGSSEYCENESLPIAAIVYLQQSPETTIRRIRNLEAFRRVWEGCSVNTWNKEDMSDAMDIVQKLISHIPVYYLACTPDDSAVMALQMELEKEHIG